MHSASLTGQPGAEINIDLLKLSYISDSTTPMVWNSRISTRNFRLLAARIVHFHIRLIRPAPCLRLPLTLLPVFFIERCFPPKRHFLLSWGVLAARPPSPQTLETFRSSSPFRSETMPGDLCHETRKEASIYPCNQDGITDQEFLFFSLQFQGQQRRDIKSSPKKIRSRRAGGHFRSRKGDNLMTASGAC